MILRAECLVKHYKKRPVVNGVSLEVKEGEIVGLLGPNGAGKTTSFYMIMGIVLPQSGRIFLGDEEITKLPIYMRARKGIGYLSQDPSVFRKLTAFQNILAILETLDLTKSEQRNRTEALLKEFGLLRFAEQRADRLSGGEIRRLEIARSLARTPKFMLLDEPFAGIDPMAVEDIQGIISYLKSRGIGLLITDHNVRETLAITDRSYILSEGRILISGTPKVLSEDPDARRIYLGERFRLD